MRDHSTINREMEINSRDLERALDELATLAERGKDALADGDFSGLDCMAPARRAELAIGNLRRLQREAEAFDAANH